jgi:transcriptional regulator with XRE-family HTH domain
MVAVDPDLMSLIAERVRARRRARGWTLDELAERSGISRRMLVNVEQGATNPSIATLLRLSEALAIGLPSLVAPNDADTPLKINRAETRAPLWTGEHGGQAFLAAGVAAPDVVELWDWTLVPGDAHASEPHVTGTRELLTVIEGELVLAVGGEEVVLRAGDAVFPRRRGARVPQRGRDGGPVRADGLRAGRGHRGAPMTAATLGAPLAAAVVDPAVHELLPDYVALIVAADGLPGGPSDERSDGWLREAEATAAERLAKSPPERWRVLAATGV